jgi:hypothetical protein
LFSPVYGRQWEKVTIYFMRAGLLRDGGGVFQFTQDHGIAA